MMSQDCHFCLEGAAKTIGNEPTNMLYMRLFLPPAQVEAIAAASHQLLWGAARRHARPCRPISSA